MARQTAPSSNGGAQPPVAKGPFFLFVLMMPVFILIILMLLLSMQYKQLKAFISPHAVDLVRIPESREAQEQVRVKLREFLSPNAPDTLALSAEEINHLARSSRPLTEMRLDYQLDLKDSVLIARNSLPDRKSVV